MVLRYFPARRVYRPNSPRQLDVPIARVKLTAFREPRPSNATPRLTATNRQTVVIAHHLSLLTNHFSPLTRSMYLFLVAERLKAKCRRVLLSGHAAKGRQKNEQKL